MQNLLHLLATGGLLLLVFLLKTQPAKSNPKATNRLTLFIFLLTCVFLQECFQILSLESIHLYWEEGSNLLIFALSPVLYLSAVCFVNPQRRLLWKEYLHFLPSVLYLILPFLMVSLVGLQNFQQFLQSNAADIDLTMLAILLCQIVLYILLSLLLIRRHRRNIALFASSTHQIDLAWLEHFLYGVVLLALLWAGELFFPFLRTYVYFGYFVAVYYLAFFALHQKEIFPFSQKETNEIVNLIEKGLFQKEKTRLLDVNQLQGYKAQLMELMNTEKPHLDQELSLPKLAKMMGLTSHELSFLLNEGFEENFYKFVNHYRVEVSKELLTNPRFSHFNMLGVAFEAGFNSKTAFNTVFKKITGQTPSGFRKKNAGLFNK